MLQDFLRQCNKQFSKLLVALKSLEWIIDSDSLTQCETDNKLPPGPGSLQSHWDICKRVPSSYHLSLTWFNDSKGKVLYGKSPFCIFLK